MDIDVLNYLLEKTPEIYEKNSNLFQDVDKYTGWYECRDYFLKQNSLFLADLEKELQTKFSKCYDMKELFLMQKLYLMYPSHPPKKLLSLSWQHIKILLGLCNLEKRNFYVDLCYDNNLEVSDLTNYILNDIYEKKLYVQTHVSDSDFLLQDDLIKKLLNIEQMIWN